MNHQAERVSCLTDLLLHRRWRNFGNPITATCTILLDDEDETGNKKWLFTLCIRNLKFESAQTSESDSDASERPSYQILGAVQVQSIAALSALQPLQLAAQPGYYFLSL